MNIARTQLTLNDSRRMCKKKNGTLISVHSQEENDFIDANMITSHIFLNGLQKHNTFIWLDRTQFNYDNCEGECVTVKGDGDCIFMEKGGAWRPEDCNATASAYACRIGTGM